MGTIKNKVCRKVVEIVATKSAILFLAARAERAGKAATASETPKIPKGKLCRLLDKLNIASEPTAKVEAKTVIIKKLTWLMTKVKVRGINKRPTFLTLASGQLKINWYL